VRRIGLLGGTFDPPHLGHLAIAEWACEQLKLDHVLFVPAGAPPHKRTVLTPAAERARLTRLAIRGNARFAVSTLELNRRGPSYTVDTLRRLGEAHDDARLFLILGEDSLADFSTWHDPKGIRQLATLVVASRPATPARRAGKVIWLDMPPIGISSTLVRQRARAGRSIRYLVPDAVARRIAKIHLYR
jgi:nicotinate-nucleotide adenylyltransferase